MHHKGASFPDSARARTYAGRFRVSRDYDNLAAHNGGWVVPNEELGRVLEMPVSCPHCPKYSMQPVAFVINSEKFTCPDCKETIDLTTKEWVAFRQKFRDALNELQPLYKQLP
jgi:hypothetical protein